MSETLCSLCAKPFFFLFYVRANGPKPGSCDMFCVSSQKKKSYTDYRHSILALSVRSCSALFDVICLVTYWNYYYGGGTCNSYMRNGSMEGINMYDKYFPLVGACVYINVKRVQVH